MAIPERIHKDNVKWLPSRRRKSVEGIVCKGSNQLTGDITPSGSKNVGLKLLSLIPVFNRPITLKGVPRNNQIRYFLDLLISFGADISILSDSLSGFDLSIHARNISRQKFEYEEIRWCRHAFLLAMSILVRTGAVDVPLPGYSHYGPRSVDGQLNGLRMMGAKIHPINNGRIFIEIPSTGLVGQEIFLPFPSNAVTEAILWASIAAKGETTIKGASQEPDLIDICNFLKLAGVKITGEGTPFIKIKGESLNFHRRPIEYSIPPDRMEIATLGAAVTIVGGEIKINGIESNRLAAIRATLDNLGTTVEENEGSWLLYAKGRPKATNITTGPFPAFPTDAQGPFMTALSLAEGTSILHEKVWANRLSQAMELKRMGANIDIHNGQIAVVKGVENLKAAQVCGTDPRATVGLILAGLGTKNK
jgi:UDP-N-acetylglucosamine 1-carboxyvinyltransferase